MDTDFAPLRLTPVELLPGNPMLKQALEAADHEGAAIDLVSLRWSPQDGYQAVMADLDKCRVMPARVEARGGVGRTGWLGWRDPARTAAEWQDACRVAGREVAMPDDGGLWLAYAADREAAADLEEKTSRAEEGAPLADTSPLGIAIARSHALLRARRIQTYRRQAEAARALAAAAAA